MRLDRVDGDSLVERRLAALQPLVVATALRWAHRHRRDAEDLGQEILLALWRCLRDRPDLPVTYLAQVAEHAPRDALRREKSVDKALAHDGRRREAQQLASLEALMEDEVGWQELEFRLARRPRRVGVPRPTEELALARLVVAQLRARLTPRQRQVLGLRLRGYSGLEIMRRLGLASTSNVPRMMGVIRRQFRELWEDSLPLPDHDTGWATTGEAAGELNLSRVRVISLCREGKIVGAQRVERSDRRGMRWLIPRPVRRV